MAICFYNKYTSNSQPKIVIHRGQLCLEPSDSFCPTSTWFVKFPGENNYADIPVQFRMLLSCWNLANQLIKYIENITNTKQYSRKRYM